MLLATVRCCANVLLLCVWLVHVLSINLQLKFVSSVCTKAKWCIDKCENILELLEIWGFLWLWRCTLLTGLWRHVQWQMYYKILEEHTTWNRCSMFLWNISTLSRIHSVIVSQTAVMCKMTACHMFFFII